MSKRVEFDVVANTRQAQQGFQQLDQQIAKNTKGLDVYQQRQRQANIASMSFMRIAQDAPFFMSSMNMGIMAVSNNIPMFIESMERAKTATGNWRTAILSVGKQMLTVPNLLMLGVSAITAYSIWAGNAAREQKELNKEFDAFSKIMKFGAIGAGSEIDINAENIGTYITATKNRLAKLQDKQNPIIYSQQDVDAQSKLAEGFMQMTENASAIKTLEEFLEKLEKYNEELKEYGKIREEVDKIETKAGGSIAPSRPNDHWAMLGNFVGDLGEDTVGDMDMPQYHQDSIDQAVKNHERLLRERKRLFNDTFVQPAAETFSIAMNSAWDGVFGHANSLLEIFLQRFATGLIDTFAQNAASSLFSFIPGVGGLLDLIFKPSVGGAGGASANLQYAQRLNV